MDVFLGKLYKLLSWEIGINMVWREMKIPVNFHEMKNENGASQVNWKVFDWLKETLVKMRVLLMKLSTKLVSRLCLSAMCALVTFVHRQMSLRALRTQNIVFPVNVVPFDDSGVKWATTNRSAVATSPVERGGGWKEGRKIKSRREREREKGGTHIWPRSDLPIVRPPMTLPNLTLFYFSSTRRNTGHVGWR